MFGVHAFRMNNRMFVFGNIEQSVTRSTLAGCVRTVQFTSFQTGLIKTLYALEVNMGKVWAFSSKIGIKSRTFIGVETMQQQYNLFETCADAIIENARRLLDLS